MMGTGGAEGLPLRGGLLNPAGHIHPFHHAPEGREALPVLVSLAAFVELGLVPDADEEVRSGRVGLGPRHGDGPVHMFDPRLARALEGDRRELLLLAGGGDARLDDLDLDGLPRLVLGGDGPVEAAPVVEAAVNVLEEVLRGDRGVLRVEGHFDGPEGGLDLHGDGSLVLTLEDPHTECHEGEHQHSFGAQVHRPPPPSILTKERSPPNLRRPRRDYNGAMEKAEPAGTPPTYDLRSLGEGLGVYASLDRLAGEFLRSADRCLGPALAEVPTFLQGIMRGGGAPGRVLPPCDPRALQPGTPRLHHHGAAVLARFRGEAGHGPHPARLPAHPAERLRAQGDPVRFRLHRLSPRLPRGADHRCRRAVWGPRVLLRHGPPQAVQGPAEKAPGPLGGGRRLRAHARQRHAGGGGRRGTVPGRSADLLRMRSLDPQALHHARRGGARGGHPEGEGRRLLRGAHMRLSGLAGALCLALLLPTLDAVAGEPEAAEKVQDWVLDHTARGSIAEFIVVLRPQANLALAQDLPTKEAKGWFVYEALTDTAEKSQGPIRAWLDAKGIRYRAFFIVNAILVEGGDLELVLALARRDDVARIEGNPVIHNRLPVPEAEGDEGGRPPKCTASSPPDRPESVEWNIAKTNAPSVWGLGYQGQGIVVGGQDTGYRWTHAALKGKYRGWDGTTADHNYNWHDAIHGGGGSCGADTTAALRRLRPRHPHHGHGPRGRRGGEPGGDGPPGQVDRLPEHERRRRHARHVPGVLPVLPGAHAPGRLRRGSLPSTRCDHQFLGLPHLRGLQLEHPPGGGGRPEGGGDHDGRGGGELGPELRHRHRPPGHVRLGVHGGRDDVRRHDGLLQQPRPGDGQWGDETGHRGAGCIREIVHQRQ